jgi:hypothetical protein
MQKVTIMFSVYVKPPEYGVRGFLWDRICDLPWWARQFAEWIIMPEPIILERDGKKHRIRVKYGRSQVKKTFKEGNAR